MATNTYTTIQGDMWDLIAWRVYGSARYVTTLVQANPDHLQVFTFEAGVVLEAPEVPPAESESANLPPWRRRR